MPERQDKCLYESCTNDRTGKSAFCGKSCRAQHSRRNRLAQQAKLAGVTLPISVALDEPVKVAILENMQDRFSYEQQAPRTNPDSLNYGDHMNSDQLHEAGLKANRVPIPGDSDYSGVCVKQDGVWAARKAG